MERKKEGRKWKVEEMKERDRLKGNRVTRKEDKGKGWTG